MSRASGASAAAATSFVAVGLDTVPARGRQPSCSAVGPERVARQALEKSEDLGLACMLLGTATVIAWGVWVLRHQPVGAGWMVACSAVLAVCIRRLCRKASGRRAGRVVTRERLVQPSLSLLLCGLAALPWGLLHAGLAAEIPACARLCGASGCAVMVLSGRRPAQVCSALLMIVSPGLCSLAGAAPLDMGIGGPVALSTVFALLGAGAAAIQDARRHIRLQSRRDEQGLIERLRSERDGALMADQEKGRLLALASHDLRQPVYALGLFAATLERRLQGSVDQPLARNLVRGMENLDRSLHSMLDVARLDEGLVRSNIQYFSLRDVFRRLHMHFAGLAELSNLGLRFSPGGKTVLSDPELLERLLGNLIQNAMRHTACGGVVVVARTLSDRINVEVWDTGCGIEPDALPRIFDDFFRVDRGRVKSGVNAGQGLGLGLPIVKRLARLLGHELTVVSRPGRGTLFRVGIPIGELAKASQVAVGAETIPMTFLQEQQAPIAVRALDAPLDLDLSAPHIGQHDDGIEAIRPIRSSGNRSVTAPRDTTSLRVRRARSRTPARICGAPTSMSCSRRPATWRRSGSPSAAAADVGHVSAPSSSPARPSDCGRPERPLRSPCRRWCGSTRPRPRRSGPA